MVTKGEGKVPSLNRDLQDGQPFYQSPALEKLEDGSATAGDAGPDDGSQPFFDHQEPVSAQLDGGTTTGHWHPYNHSQNPGPLNSLKTWWQDGRQGGKICMGRADYWWGYLTLFLLTLLADFAFVTPMLMAGISIDSAVVDGVTRLIGVPIYILSVVNTVERLHDTGHSGWNFLWVLTGIGAVYVIILCCLKTKWSEQRWPRL